MGNSSSRFASCAESILTGTTKREQWLEERCTELARQNEQLRTKMLHGDVVEPFAGVTRQASTPYIERGGAPATTPAANYELKAESGLESYAWILSASTFQPVGEARPGQQGWRREAVPAT